MKPQNYQSKGLIILMENNSFWDSTMFRRGSSAVLILLAVFLLGKSLNEFKQYDGDPANLNTITVNGVGEVLAIPDIATFSFTIMEEGTTVPDAQKKATEKNNAVIKFLRDKGIEDKDIVSTPSVNPKYEYSQRPCTQWSCPPSNGTISGYQASYYVTVKVRKADDAGAITAGLSGLGVGNLSGVSYTIDNDKELQLEARTKAIEDAKKKAQRLAKDLDVELDEIVSFSEGGMGGMPMFTKAANESMDMATAMPTPDLPRGENQIISNVSVTFRID